MNETKFERYLAAMVAERITVVAVLVLIAIGLTCYVMYQINDISARQMLILEDTTYLREKTSPEVDHTNSPTLETEQEEEVPAPLWRELGEFKITHYCPCAKCCGRNTGITATGTVSTEGRTIGVDPDVIPYGTKVMINGTEYIAEDTGAITGNKIDIYVSSHQKAVELGTYKAKVLVRI